jgi:hypothetical protein
MGTTRGRRPNGRLGPHLDADTAPTSIGERLLRLYEEESSHLRQMDEWQLLLARRGQIFGFLVAAMFLIAAFTLVMTGHSVEGTIIGSVDLVALSTVFVASARINPQSAKGGEGERHNARYYESVLQKQTLVISNLQTELGRVSPDSDPTSNPEPTENLETAPVAPTQSADVALETPNTLDLHEEDKSLWLRIQDKLTRHP